MKNIGTQKVASNVISTIAEKIPGILSGIKTAQD
jgi:hypothetical protein